MKKPIIGFLILFMIFLLIFQALPGPSYYAKSSVKKQVAFSEMHFSAKYPVIESSRKSGESKVFLKSASKLLVFLLLSQIIGLLVICFETIIIDLRCIVQKQIIFYFHGSKYKGRPSLQI